ncbi:NUDIX hydrolase N-terminal domain-containing protein [Wenzhouxiangella sp. AB-CW3]|uniref:NUDIX hydrolase n=1 Tax=Wenzhouxiangella sp. AB-CW3 TaxID=2771012 RepID=UPI00168B1440|nr:NUDIX hydrolase N-terminal domain-containing protein [Wenzhouxiangella sp. AB-CW3]QOC21612.1 NUDIX hydrolase N-terminal domain-containing protein [Wenzhouxiangella sp. AB-CW3]
MENDWLTYAKKLQAIASTGLHFSQDPHDRDRYDEIANIANEMLARIGDIPVSRIKGLVSDFAKGYATPRIDVRAAVIHEDRILLVRERADGLWTLPGGYAEVGLSPRENILKEVHEEAGIHVNATNLYAIRHKARHDYDQDARDFYKMFFLCKPRCKTPPSATGAETTAAAYFPPSDLPPLSTSRVLPRDIEDAFTYAASATPAIMFD